MEDIVFKDVVTKFDFIETFFVRLKPDFENGISLSEYYRRAGLLFSLKKEESRIILEDLKSKYPMLVEKNGGIWLSWCTADKLRR